MHPFDLTQTDRLLTSTRSVRKRLDFSQPVSRDIVLECLDVALQAPSGGNRQPWRWLIVDDADVRAQLGELYRKSHDPYQAAYRAALERAGVSERYPIIDSSQYLSDHMHEAPVMVIPCLLERMSAGASAMDTAGFYGSILPAAWSLMLALRSRGLGSAWTTLHLAYEREAAEVLGIPDTVTQCALLPVAYYVGDDFRPAKRRPAREVSYFNRWKQK